MPTAPRPARAGARRGRAAAPLALAGLVLLLTLAGAARAQIPPGTTGWVPPGAGPPPAWPQPPLHAVALLAAWP